jgi:hypothetical protein
MKRSLTTRVALGLLGYLASTSGALAQDALQQKLAAARQAAAQNQQALRAYSWLQQMEASYKGEAKKTTVKLSIRIQNNNYQRVGP